MAGSSAPRFQWKRDPAGRTALITLLYCAYHLGFPDDVICYESKFPSLDALVPEFLRIMPWFPAYYDQYRSVRAQSIGFQGKVVPFNSSDLYDRLKYMFWDSGIGDEHPKSTEQAKPGKLRETYVEYGGLIMDCVEMGQVITVEQALRWGRPKDRAR